VRTLIFDGTKHGGTLGVVHGMHGDIRRAQLSGDGFDEKVLMDGCGGHTTRGYCPDGQVRA